MYFSLTKKGEIIIPAAKEGGNFLPFFWSSEPTGKNILPLMGRSVSLLPLRRDGEGYSSLPPLGRIGEGYSFLFPLREDFSSPGKNILPLKRNPSSLLPLSLRKNGEGYSSLFP